MRTAWMLTALLAVGQADASLAEEEGAKHVAALCTVCHQDDLIHQQRLTEEQWRATVEKMAHWGAQVGDAAVKEAIVSYLATHYGPEAGSFPPARIEPEAARAAVAPLPDEQFGGGDAARGEQLYGQDCIACHGPVADGLIGVNLVDRPILFQARDFATILHEGKKPMMPGRSIDDAGIADLLAYLRSLPR